MKLTKTFFDEIKALIHSARATVARGVDLVQVYTNFEIGRRIVVQEQKGRNRAAYGEEVIKALAERLTKEFGRGYSERSLELTRRFFQLYQDRSPPIAQSVIAELEERATSQSLIAKSAAAPIFRLPTDKSAPPRPFCLSWTHYIFLLGIKNPDERSFYELESAAQDWTVRKLKRQFDSSLYERLALSRDKKGIRKLAKEGQIITAPTDLLKEPLVLEFLGLEEQARFSESDLEAAIISHIEHFLLELGKGFLFEVFAS